MSRLIGLGATLIKNNDLEDDSLNRGFIIEDFSFKEDTKEVIKEDINNAKDKTVKVLKDSPDQLSQANKKIKEKAENKIKSEEKKKELPPLPNIGNVKNENINASSINNQDKLDSQKDKLEIKKNKPFKMDTSFLEND